MIEIRLENREVIDALRGLQERSKNLRPVFAEIGEIMRSSIMENFLQKGRPKWPRLSEVTQALRAKKKKWPGPILQVSRQLMNSIQRNVYPDRVEVGTNKIYAAVMQFGAKKGTLFNGIANIPEHTRRKSAASRKSAANSVTVRAHQRRIVTPWGDIPPRPFLVFQERDVDDILRKISDYLTG